MKTLTGKDQIEPVARRRMLLNEMTRLKSQGIDCSRCRGECCTSLRNSMRISTREARDIVEHLRRSGQATGELIAKLKKTIQEFRLDVELPRQGARSAIRRSYTCPFYSPGPRGCRLPPSVKPFGCLAFNPITPMATGLASGCRSDQELLSRQQAETVRDTDHLEPEPIPIAVLKQLIAHDLAPA